MHINPLSHTANSFADAMVALHGKGRQQAVALYQSLYRYGSFSVTLPHFQNAPKLYEKMVESASFSLYPLKIPVSSESALRYLLETDDQYLIESVLIGMKTRNTVCVSSQIGCRMGCRFCATGRMGFRRNLLAHEIVQQFFTARFVIGKKVQNVVFMGMGEPFDNFDEVMKAVDILSDEAGIGVGLRRMTISTSGDIHGILRFTEMRRMPNLAVSLHSADENIRNELLPARRNEPLPALYEVMKNYCKRTGRQILISCALLKGVNDDMVSAEKLANYLQGLSVKVNIIPYNYSGQVGYESPEPHAVQGFLTYLRRRNICSLLRSEKGGESQAACGQLGGNSTSHPQELGLGLSGKSLLSQGPTTFSYA